MKIVSNNLLDSEKLNQYTDEEKRFQFRQLRKKIEYFETLYS